MIVLCDNCKGTGSVKYDVGIHKTEYEISECKQCEGTGRLLQTTVITYKPYRGKPSSEKKF